MGAKRGTPEERFWRHVNKSDGCWEWSGARSDRGYGSLGVNGRTALAHRMSWELHNGPITDGLHVCHRCDNPPCVRPDHLFLGTRSDNLSDASAKGRLAGRATPRGTAHSHARLNDEAVIAIRSIYDKRKGTVSAADLGFLFQMSETQVFNVIHRAQWRHVS